MPDNSAATDIVQTSAPRLTPSSVGDLRCPAKYKHLRIDRNWPKRDVILPVAHGKAVHAVLRDVYTERSVGTVDASKLEAQSRAAVRNTWYPKEADREEQVKRVVCAVRGFIDADDEEDIRGILGLEQQGEFEIRLLDGRVLCVVSAKLDCLLVRASDPDTLVIRERKTTAQRVDLAESYLMMRVARKMYPQYGKVAIEYDWLDEDCRVVRDTVTMAEVRGQHQIVLGLAYRVLTATEFPAIAGEAVCKFCPRRSLCQSLPADEVSEATLRGYAERCPGGAT